MTLVRRRAAQQPALQVSARMARRLLPLGDTLKVDVAALYRRHQVGVEELDDPSGRIALEVVLDVLEALHAEARCPQLGIELARHATPEAYHAPGLLLLASNDLREGLARAFAFQRLWGDGDRFALAEPRDLAIEAEGLGITFGIPAPRRLGHELLEVCALAETLNAARLLAERPDAVPIAFGLPSMSDDSAALRAHFGQAPRLGVRTAFIVLPEDWASAPLPNANAIFFRIFEQQADAELARLPVHDDLRVRLRAEILRGLTRGRFKLGDCARALGLSPRTLERRLAELGAVFRDEVDSVRREHAERVLRVSPSVDEAALVLGYSERASFHRACVRWFGKTPAQLRPVKRH